jgi:hypothetical protein
VRHVGALLFGCALALVGHEASATLFDETALVALVTRADLVVTGAVESCEARIVPARGLRIVTFCRVVLDETLRGQATVDERATRVLTVAFPGGQVGDVGQHVFGAPQLHDGDRALFLLGPATGPGAARGIVGLAHGVRMLLPDGALGEPDDAATPASSFGGVPSPKARAAPGDDPRTLDAFKRALGSMP